MQGVEIHTLCPLYGDKFRSWRSVYEWIRMLKVRQTSVTDTERSGCTSTSTALKYRKKLKPLITDRRVTITKTAQKLNAS